MLSNRYDVFYVIYTFLPSCVMHPNEPLYSTGEISTMNKGTMVELIPTDNPIMALPTN